MQLNLRSVCVCCRSLNCKIEIEIIYMKNKETGSTVRFLVSFSSRVTLCVLMECEIQPMMMMMMITTTMNDHYVCSVSFLLSPYLPLRNLHIQFHRRIPSTVNELVTANQRTIEFAQKFKAKTQHVSASRCIVSYEFCSGTAVFSGRSIQ